MQPIPTNLTDTGKMKIIQQMVNADSDTPEDIIKALKYFKRQLVVAVRDIETRLKAVNGNASKAGEMVTDLIDTIETGLDK